MHPQRRTPTASLAGRLGQLKLSVGPYRLGMALHELYLNELYLKDTMSITIDGFWGRTDTRRSRIAALYLHRFA